MLADHQAFQDARLSLITNTHVVLPLKHVVLPLAVMLAAAGCAQKPAEPKTPAPQYLLTASVQQLMEGLIDPSADALWDSVAYIATASGIEDRQPRTPEQWQAVRTSAVNLIEAANLLCMPGRIVADDPAGSPPGDKLGELSHHEIQQRIDASHEAFVQFARGLQAATQRALAAIDAKNAQDLMDAGATIDEACEACHVTYWYPNQRRP
jgi:cytochrome c556